MGAWSSFGKFDSRITERCYDLTLHGGADEETGDVEGNGWYAIFHFRRASVIIREDSQGFVRSEMGTKAEMESLWSDIEAAEAALHSDDEDNSSNWSDED